uniref:Uncharacterized protein n=1 Tax=Galaxaura rugosa TaxID=268570 RepID=A0A1G4NSU0_9FLOR|nr:Hypothetical protein ycf58 [Galaxaura rugosa]SCW21741.1 Hypothetical protein ycf58 [Galaxaura rugosa]
MNTFFFESNLGTWKTIQTLYNAIHKNCYLNKSRIDIANNHLLNLQNSKILYKINQDRHLSIEYNYGDLNIVEKIWLVNSNVRLSISMIQKRNKCIFISFSSDIKLN